jgi:signal transduction histidine kinase
MPAVGDYIEQHHGALIERFAEEAGKLDSARGLTQFQIIDTFPEYLHVLVESSQRQEPPTEETRSRLEETHVGLRLRLGYMLEEVLFEYQLLGRLITDLWEQRPAEEQPAPKDVELLFTELQAAMEHATRTFGGYTQEERQYEKRYLRRLDALAPELSTQEERPAPFSARIAPLLAVIREAVGADCASLMLLRKETPKELELVASVGAWEAGPGTYRAALGGRSFAATLARTSEPVGLADAANAQVEVPPGLEEAGIHSLLGMRLWPFGKLLGVFWVGQRELSPFLPRARRLLETLCEHLAGAVSRAWLYDELRARVQFEEQLLAIVSHDLRNPLSAILLTAQTQLERDGEEPRQAQAYARIASAANRAHRLIRDVLDFSRARMGGQIPLQPEETDVHVMARQVVDEVRTARPDREIRLFTSGDGHGRWDPDRLAQVLTNLVTNAVQYSPDGSPVTVRSDARAGEVELSVHNEGPPVSAEVRQRLFEPLERTDPPPTSEGRRVGLGLFIVRQVVQAHGGTVEVTSEAGAGTTFAVRLPTHGPRAQASGEVQPSPTGPGRPMP